MKTKEREEARRIRKQEGISISKIAKRLGVSVGSVSLWVRDVVLTKKQKKVLKDNCLNIGLLAKYSEKTKREAAKKREQWRMDGFKRAGVDDIFRVICGIYWGDGTKNKNMFGISNCDPRMINVIGNWAVKEGHKNIGFRIQCPDATTKSDVELKKWWKNELDFLEDSMIRKFVRYSINRASQWKNVGKQPNGTAHIYIGNTELVQNVFGGMEYLGEMKI